MSIVGKMNLVGFLDSTCIVVARLNYLIEFCKTICLDLIQVKPLDRSTARLNHLVELYEWSAIAVLFTTSRLMAMSETTLAFARVNYYELVNNN